MVVVLGVLLITTEFIEIGLWLLGVLFGFVLTDDAGLVTMVTDGGGLTEEAAKGLAVGLVWGFGLMWTVGGLVVAFGDVVSPYEEVGPYVLVGSLGLVTKVGGTEVVETLELSGLEWGTIVEWAGLSEGLAVGEDT